MHRFLMIAVAIVLLTGCAAPPSETSLVADETDVPAGPEIRVFAVEGVVIGRDISARHCADDGVWIGSYSIPLFWLQRQANDTHAAVELRWDDMHGLQELTASVDGRPDLVVRGASPLVFEVDAAALASIFGDVKVRLEGQTSHCDADPIEVSAIIDTAVATMVSWNA